jgi:hypothetical protein
LQQSAVLVWQYLTLYVQFCVPDDGRRNRLKHVEQFIEINKSKKHMNVKSDSHIREQLPQRLINTCVPLAMTVFMFVGTTDILLLRRHTK